MHRRVRVRVHPRRHCSPTFDLCPRPSGWFVVELNASLLSASIGVASANGPSSIGGGSPVDALLPALGSVLDDPVPVVDVPGSLVLVDASAVGSAVVVSDAAVTECFSKARLVH